jgi:hypothetical protein
MKNYFDILAYKELVELERSRSGKIAEFDENFLKLLEYRASISDQIGYNRKTEYFLLIPYEFRLQFLEMHRNDSKKARIILE